jgi:DNA repair protein RadC
LALDNANKIIGTQIIDGGTNQCAIYPDNVFRFLLLSGASGFILAHNHPGGSRNPSEADWSITEKLEKACSLFNICFLDHVIIASGEPVSMRGMSRWR